MGHEHKNVKNTTVDIQYWPRWTYNSFEGHTMFSGTYNSSELFYILYNSQKCWELYTIAGDSIECTFILVNVGNLSISLIFHHIVRSMWSVLNLFYIDQAWCCFTNLKGLIWNTRKPLQYWCRVVEQILARVKVRERVNQRRVNLRAQCFTYSHGRA